MFNFRKYVWRKLWLTWVTCRFSQNVQFQKIYVLLSVVDLGDFQSSLKYFSRCSNFENMCGAISATYIFCKIKACYRISWRDLTSQPSQPALTTHIFSKFVLSGNYFSRNGKSPKSTGKCDIYVLDRATRKTSSQIRASHPFQQQLRHIHFGKLDFARIHSSKSPKSTTDYTLHIFEIWTSR